MSADLLEPLARLATTADAIEGLRDLFAAEEPLDDIAARVAETAVAAIPYADAVSITVLSWPDARTAACTHERALELDHQQYASGRGRLRIRSVRCGTHAPVRRCRRPNDQQRQPLAAFPRNCHPA